MELGSSYISSWRQASHGFGPELTNKTGLWLYSKKKQLAGANSQQQFPADILLRQLLTSMDNSSSRHQQRSLKRYTNAAICKFDTEWEIHKKNQFAFARLRTNK